MNENMNERWALSVQRFKIPYSFFFIYVICFNNDTLWGIIILFQKQWLNKTSSYIKVILRKTPDESQLI